jgi:hypothetical protein
MKRINLLLILMILLPFCVLAQNPTWAVKAVAKGGEELSVNVYLEDGTPVPVFAIYEDGNDHFMDVKGVHNGKIISIKLVQTNDILIPVKGISETGDILKVKAEDSMGNILDVKGVSRDGNTINIAAVKMEGDYIPLKAISPEGVERNVKGVKFMRDNVEMEVGDVKILAHLKALPTIDVGDIDNKWEITASTDEGQNLSVVAINKKGKEYPVRALMPGKHPYLMNVRAQASSVDIFIKLVKNDKGVFVSGIDEFGRLYEIKAKATNGESFEVIGGEKKGNVIPIYVLGSDSKKHPVKAISSKGHEFDVKGIKVMESEIEGLIQVIDGYIEYYAHIKALAPAQANKK